MCTAVPSIRRYSSPRKLPLSQDVVKQKSNNLRSHHAHSYTESVEIKHRCHRHCSKLGRPEAEMLSLVCQEQARRGHSPCSGFLRLYYGSCKTKAPRIFNFASFFKEKVLFEIFLFYEQSGECRL